MILRGRFESIQRLCFVLAFEGDLLNPGDRGERVGIIHDGTFGFGFQNVSAAAVAEVERCSVVGSHDARIAPFLDGRETITVHMVEGSATLASVTVRVTGVRR